MGPARAGYSKSPVPAVKPDRTIGRLNSGHGDLRGIGWRFEGNSLA